MAESDERAVTWDQSEWEPAERAIHEWVTGVLTSSGVAVVWRDKPRERVVQVPYLELALGAEVPVGWDETTYDESADGEGLAITVSGAREVMLSAVVRTRDQRTFGMARRYLGKLRQSLHHPAYVQLLDAAGLGLVDCEPIREIGSKDTHRVESLSILEVKFSLEQVYQDAAADEQVGFVELVEVGISLDGEPAEIFEVDLAFTLLEGGDGSLLENAGGASLVLG